MIPSSQLSSLPTYVSMSQSRLKTLYSDFSLQKHSNPTSYASIIVWWRRTLESVVSKGWLTQSDTTPSNIDRLVLHAPGTTLADEFRYEGVGKPLGLPTAIAELRSSKAYFLLPDFLNSTKSIYDPGWLPYRLASYVVGKPLWWTLKQLSIVSADETILGDVSYEEKWKRVMGDYVIVSVLERAADSVLARQRSKGMLSLADALYNMESFREEFAAHALDNVVLSKLDIRVLVRYLERDRKAVVTQGGVIKFLEPNSTEPPEITAVDTGVLELKTAVEKLEAQVDSIHTKIRQRAEQIKTALQQKRKEIALSHLRAQKQLEALLKQRLGSLDTLHSALLRVEQSAGDVEIMKSYESSTTTLRAILAHPSLQREKIDETMEAMASANEDAKEIDDAIRLGTDIAQGDAAVDDAELEDEWKALVQEAEKESAAKAEEEKVKKEAEEAQVKEVTLTAEALRVPSSVPTEPTHGDRVAVKGQA
ncbi:Snf7-domain-containing protein [Fomitopsis betulina]|nr:Snf7-domain-containing protein [Fomitopsis betulina]KAI0736736.1 Snf7-domain-containing protein [Fomitopsis betulina]